MNPATVMGERLKRQLLNQFMVVILPFQLFGKFLIRAFQARGKKVGLLFLNLFPAGANIYYFLLNIFSVIRV